MKDDLIRSIKTEADYQAALNRARSLMSCRPNTPKADELEIVEYLTLELY
jgi:HTH-type transcriptional regulator / antitoxin HigA